MHQFWVLMWRMHDKENKGTATKNMCKMQNISINDSENDAQCQGFCSEMWQQIFHCRWFQFSSKDEEWWILPTDEEWIPMQVLKINLWTLLSMTIIMIMTCHNPGGSRLGPSCFRPLNLMMNSLHFQILFRLQTAIGLDPPQSSVVYSLFLLIELRQL